MFKTKFVTARLKSVCALALAFGFVACSDDDDDPSDSGAAGVFTPVEGDHDIAYRIYSFDEFDFDYDSNGRLESYCYHDVKYNPMRIVDDGIEVKIGLNSSGYISSLNVTESYADEYERYTGSSKADYSYNSNGELVKVSVEGKSSGMDYGERFSYKYSMTSTLTWINGLLVSIKTTENEEEDGEKWRYVDTYNYDYIDGTNVNICRQLPYLFCDGFPSGELSGLGLLGLFGKGPKLLPVSAEIKYEEWDSDYYDYDTDTDHYWYSFESNGLIRSENGERYCYEEVPRGRSGAPVLKRLSERRHHTHHNRHMKD